MAIDCGANINFDRVRYISEVIDGIASVKSYAWETAFFQMIRQLRAQETKYIARSQVLRAVNQGLMFCTAAVVAFATFGVYWGNGGQLHQQFKFHQLFEADLFIVEQGLRIIFHRTYKTAPSMMCKMLVKQVLLKITFITNNCF